MTIFNLKCSIRNMSTQEIEHVVETCVGVDELVSQSDKDEKWKEVLGDFLQNTIPQELSKTTEGQEIWNNRSLYTLEMSEPLITTQH